MNFVSVPVYSIGKKLPTASRAQSPGPGNYEAHADNPTLNNKGPAWSMGNEKRADMVGKAMTHTGPGSYDTCVTTMGHVNGKMGNDTRKGIAAANLVPGPGVYSPQIKDYTPMGKIGTSTRNDHRPTTTVPGPGQYNLLDDKNADGTKYSFGSSIQRPRHDTAKGNNTGPGCYNPDKAKKHNQMTGFAQSKRTDIASSSVDRVGPGNYDLRHGNIEKSVENKRGWTIAARNKSIGETTKVPGPGLYTPVHPVNTDTGTRIGTAKRLDLTSQRSMQPGPGQYYNPDKSSMQKLMGMFGKDGRAFGAKGTLAPGPGQYNFAGYRKDRPAAWGFGTQRRQIGHVQNKSMTVPGPGAYTETSVEVNSRITSGIKYSMGSGSRATKHTTLAPGPGNYNIKDSMDTRGARMGTEERKFVSDKKANGPDPGTYNIKSTVPDVSPCAF